MQIGDLCFFAESSCKVPGLVGTMEVVGTARPDPSQFSKDSPYYDPKASEDNPKWDMVMVEFRSKFKAKLPAAKLKEHAASPGDPLGRLELFRQTRLSVSNVKPDEWAFIMTLVEANDAAPEPSKTPKKVNKKKTDDTAVTARKPGRKSMPASTSAPKDEVTTPAAARKGKAPKAPATEPRPKTKTPKRKSGAHKSKPSDEEDEEAQPLTPTQDEPADTIPSPPQANAEEAQAEGEAEDIDAPLPSIEGFEPTSATQMESSGRGLLGRIGEGIVHALASPGKAVSRALSGTPAPPTEREKERESAVAAMGVDVGILGGVLEEDEE
ncbi:hypothetical protein ANO11243_074790 [Dothideomycetidae sp. 11243]|nr:hypothetical protein ANO11243_074790 [fungal sp. No.11243]